MSVEPILTITDVSNNSSSCTANVIVRDTIRPIAACMDTTIFLNTNGTITIDSTFVNNGSSDNCTIATATISQSNFNCNHIGNNNITLTITDVNNNVSSCSSVITVRDTISPITMCSDIEVTLDSHGMANITLNDINNGSMDNCGIDTLFLSQEIFNCSDTGIVTITLTAIDINNNQSSCTSEIAILPFTLQATPNVVGPSVLCADLQNIVYQVQEIPEAGSYQWSYSGSGLSFESNGQSTVQVDLETFTSGILKVDFISNTCGNIIGSSSLNLELGLPEFCILSNCGRGEIFVDDDILQQDGSLDIYRVTHLIESNATVPDDRVIQFKAGSSIDFYSNFQVELNALFTGTIEPCENGKE